MPTDLHPSTGGPSTGSATSPGDTPGQAVVGAAAGAGSGEWHLLPAEQSRATWRSTRLWGWPTTRPPDGSGPTAANQLDEAARRPGWRRFLDQFRSVLIGILLAAAVLASLVGTFKDTVVITVVLLVNATLGFVQENRAEASVSALRDLQVPTARVRRAGTVRVVDAAELVPGDLVLLEAGDRPPADGRLLVAESVEVDESALTGESQPVAKGAAPVAPQPGGQVPLAARSGMAYMTTGLTRGRAELVVTRTGMHTEVGAIAALLQQGAEPPTPLQRQLDDVGKRIALIGGVAVALYVVLALCRGQEPAELALSAVALAGATVPEGLPAVLSLTLALGVGRMARRGAVVKRLASVETLGAATVICSDKTGTLTLNQMTARVLVVAGQHVRVLGEGHAQTGALVDATTGAPAERVQALLEPMLLCSDAVLTVDGVAPGIVGDPTEGALVVVAAKSGLDAVGIRAARPRTGELPFDSGLAFMATLHAEDGRTRVYLRGAPDVLLERATHLLTASGVARLDPVARAGFAAEVTRLASSGLRVLAAATVLLDDPPDRTLTGADGRDLSAADREDQLADRLTGLTLLGLVGMADPPRPQAREAIAVAHRAGVAAKMITGDQRDTAVADARELGIEGEVATGTDLDAMSADELADRIDTLAVFARVFPAHKVAIVTALTERGHVVAMTGDGVNDAAAVRAAHIGVAMGTGTEVTKRASAMVLVDDDFATIVEAIGEGRGIYDNVVKLVKFQLSSNFGAVLAFLGATAVGLPAPLNAIPVLWINIIMDGPPAMALGVDPPRPHLMDEPPRRPGTQILDRQRLLPVLRSGLVMAVGTLGVLAVARDQSSDAVALTMAFTTFVLFQVFNALNARAGTGTVFTPHLLTNRWLWASLVVIVALQVLVVAVGPLQGVFGTVALSAAQRLVCAAVAAAGLLVEEGIKLLRRGRGRRAATTRPKGAPRTTLGRAL